MSAYIAAEYSKAVCKRYRWTRMIEGELMEDFKSAIEKAHKALRDERDAAYASEDKCETCGRSAIENGIATHLSGHSFKQPATDIDKHFSQRPTPATVSEPCCERDHNRDGNCDRHPAKPDSASVGKEPWTAKYVMELASKSKQSGEAFQIIANAHNAAMKERRVHRKRKAV